MRVSVIVFFVRKLNYSSTQQVLLFSCLAVFLFSGSVCYSQENPFHYLQAVNNLYTINPAFTGADRQPVISIDYHRQQIGSIELPPQYSTLAFQTPIKNSRSSTGIALYNYSRSYFITNGFWVSFAHAVPLSGNQILRFGLSGGGNYSELDVNISDPVVARYNESFNADAQFGIAYSNKGLQIGAALTNLLGSYISSDSISNASFYTDYFLNASYVFPVDMAWQVKPFAALRSYETNDNTVMHAEGNVQVFYKQIVSMGVGWRQEAGPFALASVNVKNIAVGAAYKIASGEGNAGNPAFELQLKLFLGKKKEPIAKREVVKEGELAKQATSEDKQKIMEEPKPEDEVVDETNVSPEKDKPVVPAESKGKVKSDTEYLGNKEPRKKSEQPGKNDLPNAVSKSERDLNRSDEQVPVLKNGQVVTVDKPANDSGEENIKYTDNGKAIEINTGYYVVVSAFRMYDNAVKFTYSLQQEGFDAQFKYSSKTLFYYVFLLKGNDVEMMREQRNMFRRQNKFKDAWLLIVD